ncbi:NADPH-dependent oxidoreductase [Ligilactobacillus apodemi]|uniref:NADPH-dependent oxidoreductase n=1 Tax=Ligilactobacillus apodemi TaxID=307126 RepID=UPI00214AB7CC|nr:NADPH-dependent oxidoreductase [Ligilactobacillus apodemi]MCR1901863.1 NADPH-dependent oxidoreductase [Ligilactobacillus apodemi]
MEKLNETLTTQLNHRTIRKFSPKPVTQNELALLFEAARHTSTSEFLQQFSILRITDPAKKEAIREISHQDYVGGNGELLIFLADLNRNYQIRKQLGKDVGRLQTTDLFFQAQNDTVLAVQNTLLAAESLGLGGVILGSINDDPKRLVEVLELPKLTYPILGLQIGHPAQEPQLKPRLPLEFTVFENDYPTEFPVEKLADYDKIVHTYYDLRDANRRVDEFTTQIASAKLDKRVTKRDDIVAALHHQGLCLE